MNPYMKMMFAVLLLLAVLPHRGSAQQVIGAYPQIDGGFESQAPFSSLSATTSIPTGGTSSTWTIGLTTGGTEQIVNNAALARTGSQYAVFGNLSGAKRFQSISVGDSAFANWTRYTVQFWYRTAGATPPTNLTAGVTINGTVAGKVFPDTVMFMNATSGAWQKTTTTVYTDTASASPRYGVAFVRFAAAGTVDIDIDDFVVYPVTEPDTIDVIAPGSVAGASAGSPTNTTLNVTWSAPGGGVDGGGYVVVRGLADPTTAPNANGIYNVGQLVAPGEQVAYIGTATSFTDINLSHSTTYHYRIYAVDKAFNYATPATASGTTNTPVLASEPTSPAWGVQFANVTETSFDLSWTNGNGASRLVVIRAGSPISTDPADGGTYSANASFGSGAPVGAGYAVYKGTGTSVSVTGLTKLTRYYAAVYEFNGAPGAENYLTTSPGIGDELTLPGQILSSVSGNWNVGATWVGGIVPTSSDHVTIAPEDTVTLTASTDVYDVTVNGGLRADNALPIVSTSLRYLRVHGPLFTTNGTVGGPANAIALECWGDVTFAGTGTLSPARVRPGAGQTNISIVFDQNATLTYAGTDGSGGTALYTENGASDNITVVVNASKTLTFADYASMYTNNANSNGLASTVISINGAIQMPGANSNAGVKIAAGKSCALYVNGPFTIGRNFSATSAAGGGTSTIAIGANGTLTVGGTADFTEPSLAATGAGAFVLPSGAAINIGSPDGISSSGSTGNIQTASRFFSTGANYRYAGGSVPQTTGDGLPDTVAQLTISDTLVTLAKDVTVTDTLHLSTGDLELNGHVVTLGPLGYLREPAGHTLKGMSGGTITTTRTLNAPSALENIAGLGVRIGSSANLGSTVITRGHVIQGANSIKRYVDIAPTTNTGLNATLVLSYNFAELNDIPESTMVLFRSTNGGGTWSLAGGTLDTAANELSLAGINGFSRWTAGNPLNPPVSGPVSYVVSRSWNIISLPSAVADAHKSVLFPTATSLAYAYAGGYESKDSLVMGTGYWLKFPAKETLAIAGTQVTLDTIDIVEGWNMVGAISDPVSTSGIVQIPPGCVASQFFGYSGGYTGETTLKPAQGYWVKGGAGGGKIVLASAAAAPKEAPADAVLSGMNELTVTDAQGHRQTLLFGARPNGALDLSRYELPPPPPSGISDVRFASGRFAESFGGSADVKEILLQALHFPVTVAWRIGDGRSFMLSATGNAGFRLEQPIAGAGSVMLRADGVRSLSLGSSGLGTLPAEFALGANYPNPFNPTTKMRIALPVDAPVALKVYDMLGRVVATLLRETLPAGYHTVEWNGLTDEGRPAVSGVYFVRMESGAFSAMQKMLLVK